MPKVIGIIGLGWLGKALAKHILRQGYTVRGTTTSRNKVDKLSALLPCYVTHLAISKDNIIGDIDTFIEGLDILIINFPPKRIEDIEHIYPAQMQQIVQKTPKNMRVIFTSSTSVYQGTNTIVNETTYNTPQTLSGKAVLKAEQILKQHFGKHLNILRLAGLIGPERHPGKFLANKTQLKNPNHPINLVHQTDCILAIEKTITSDCFGEIINICSDKHPLRKDFYTEASTFLNLPSPTFKTLCTNNEPYKIIDNTKSKSMLGMEYIYADPKSIFQDIEYTVHIIGVGPGDIHLLTLQAFQTIQCAEIMLYDNLVSKEILSINNTAKKIYVGRKYGDATNQEERQQNINQLLLKYFKEHKKVCRLKSGDPYIYGRAAEEAIFLKQHNIPFQVIPGISAGLAAASIYNIPITQRHKSNAIFICTAHTADYSFEQLKGVAEILNNGNTVIIYMGLNSLDKIVSKLIQVCKKTDIPVLVASNVSRSNDFLLHSTLDNIQEDLKSSPITMPAVFLIGIHNI